MRWVFVVPADVVGSFYIVPRCGKMTGFRNWYSVSNYLPSVPGIPKDNYTIFQQLDGGQIQAKQEYILWFAFNHQGPVTIHLAILLIPNGSGPMITSAADVARELGVEPPDQQH